MKDGGGSLGSKLLISMTITAVCLAAAYASPPARLVKVEENIQSEGYQLEARQLWERAVTAKGGRERLRKIGSIYVRTILSHGDRTFCLYVFPDYSFEYSYWSDRESTSIEVYNHKRAITWWLPSTTNVAQAIPRERRGDDPSSNIIAQFLYLMVTNWMDPKPLGVRKERLGLKRVDVIEVDANGWPVDYYLDPKTLLPIQVVSEYSFMAHEKGEKQQVIKLDDYAPIDGVMMPRKLSYSYTYPNARERWTESVSYELNPAYDSQFFEHPPTPRTLPDSWRAKSDTSKKN
jgi:hypothetical protein